MNTFLWQTMSINNLVSSCLFEFPSQNVRNQARFYIPTYSTSYVNNHPIDRLLRSTIQVSSLLICFIIYYALHICIAYFKHRIQYNFVP